MLECAARALRSRNGRERDAFEAIVASWRAQSHEILDLRTQSRDKDRELLQLRHEAADVLGRKEASEEAARLEGLVLELQRELKQERHNAAQYRRTAAAATETLGRATVSLEETERRLRSCEAEVAVLTSQRDEARRDVVTLSSELERKTKILQRLEEEATLYRRENEELVVRSVDDKQRLITEMNSMNDIIDRLRREITLLKESTNQQLSSPGLVEEALQLPEDSYQQRWAVVDRTELFMRRCVRAHETDAVDVCAADSVAVTASSSGAALYREVDEASRGPALRAMLENTSGALCVAAYAADGVCAVACADRSVRLFDARSGRRRADVHSAHSAAAKIHALRFASKTALLTGATDRQVKLWDVQRGSRCVSARRAPSAVHALVAFGTPDAFASAHYDGLVRTWDSRSEACVAEVKACDAPLAGLATAANFLAVLGRDHTLKLLDLRTLGTLAQVSQHPSLKLASGIVRIAADANTVAVPTNSGRALLFDVATGHCAAELAVDPPYERPLVALDVAISNRAASARRVLLTLDALGFLRLWDS